MTSLQHEDDKDMGGHSVQPVLDEKGVHQRHDLDGAVTNVDELRQGFSSELG